LLLLLLLLLLNYPDRVRRHGRGGGPRAHDLLEARLLFRRYTWGMMPRFESSKHRPRARVTAM
jgi:hypothetical protein